MIGEIRGGEALSLLHMESGAFQNHANVPLVASAKSLSYLPSEISVISRCCDEIHGTGLKFSTFSVPILHQIDHNDGTVT